jgi:type II secretory ATPase GspE/PulE/Tfp pilus assembly ATPase PilB-like protein
MNILNTGNSKILTVEDPVAYQIPGITQVHVKQSIGLTFASALRSFLRQDPDIILVGEIRDRETAEIAINAALTGHLVLSTLHTNAACGAISRLQDMGVENFLISTALVGVLSQRLIRQICPECQSSGIDSEGKKCRNCSGSGYRGRIGIFEFLEVNEKIRKAINSNKDNASIAAIAKENGMKFLNEDGAKKVEQGISSQAEISRVCQLDGTT